MADDSQKCAQAGDRVRVSYVGRFADGTVFDSSEGHPPLEFTIGAGEVIAGFDAAVTGLSPGERRSVEIAPEQGYGLHLPEMVAEVERSRIPDSHLLAVGNFLEVSTPRGDSFEMRVAGLTETTVTLDGNHPLAGKTLFFEVELLNID
ncbi:MAG: peptidylprolyl isomerase [Deltaproteobacteria bacterium]|nr:MAG: peptidylprolyl isomerase [Deltaproteobacteria bacterium]